MTTIYITANSPGEISGFLVPVVAEIRRRFSQVRIVVLLLPCTFASGREEQVARAIPGVDDVIPTLQLWRLMIRLPAPRGTTALLHLGGDLLYAALLARRWNIPTWAFQWANPRWDRWMRGYFVKTEGDARRLEQQGIPRERTHVIGDLVVDSVRTALASNPPLTPTASAQMPSAPHFVFLPGSRSEEVRLLTPFFLEVAEHVRAVMPDSRFSLLLSPFVEFGRVRHLFDRPVDRSVGGLRGRLVRRDGHWALVSAAGTYLDVVHADPLEVMAAADFVVSIPGTKTGEAGSLGKPMLVLVPINRMEEIPWHGLLGMLDWLPILGRLVKRAIYRTMVDRYIGRIYAQPNLLGERPVIPEMIGFLTPMAVADKVLEAFGRVPVGRAPMPLRGRVESPIGPYSVNGAVDSSWSQMRTDLLELYAPFSGAAQRAVEHMANGLQAAPDPAKSAEPSLIG